MLRHTHIVAGLLLLSAPAAGAQRATTDAASPAALTLVTIDTGTIHRASISPDGRWVVYTVWPAASVWIAPVANPKPFRITSEGYSDSYATFSATGDRVFFISNRPDREAGSNARYIMSMPMDNTTGRPTGPVQQVTTDSVEYVAPYAISHDGQWLAYYAIPGKNLAALRLVRTSGGNARTLLTKPIPASGEITFSADGRYVVFPDSQGRVIREVPVTGGPVTTLFRTGAGDMLGIVPYRNDRYEVRGIQTGRVELRDASGQTLASAATRPGGSAMGWARSDGRGVMGIVNEASTSLRRVTLATGAIEDVKVPVQGFLDGVTVGGSIVTHSFGAGRVFTLTTLSPTGKVEHEVKPAAEVWYTSGGPLAGGTLLLGMGQKYPHKPVLNEYGVDTVRAWQPAYLVDPTTGAVRKLADSVDSGCCFGANYTVTGIAELRGADVEVRSIDPSGTTHLVTSFPRSSYPHRMYYWGFLSGTRLAYWGNNDTAGRSIFVTTGPTGSSTRLPVVGDFSWSPGGRKLAVVLSDRRGKDRPTVRILDIAADGSVTRTGPTLDLGVDLKDAEIGGIEWLDDASAVLVQLGGESADCNSCLVRRPLDPARPPTRVVLDRARSGSHRNLPVPAFRVDQGGKSVLFTQMSRGGASIWTAEFVPLKK